jgi:hypothetical protein
VFAPDLDAVLPGQQALDDGLGHKLVLAATMTIAYGRSINTSSCHAESGSAQGDIMHATFLLPQGEKEGASVN